ncbi:MAG: tRNA uridine(34) 5-carboxymethylaminomethyl modification radical SAM/GNAT enzyme Elp3 [Patescibacteria group bacterium]
MNDKSIKIIQSITSQHITTAEQLSRAKRQLARDFNIGIVNNNWLLKIYRECLAVNKIKVEPRLEDLLIKRRVRTLSGVAPVAVAAKPYPCPGRCIYCPSNALMPKSYLPSQPAAARALRFKYSPFRQVQGRMQAFYNNGHKLEKVELRILGGTWSAYPRKYQSWFIRELYRGLNNFSISNFQFLISNQIPNPKSQIKAVGQRLTELQRNNETAQHRCVGLSIETRPDYITLEEIKQLRKFGVTKVELGIQHLDQKVLDLIKRDQTKNDVLRATKLLKDAGFKICYHIMPNLPGSTAKLDLQTFKELFDDPNLRPDQLKIYPCVVLKNTPLYRRWKQGKYKTYNDKTLIGLLAQMKKFVPPYVRIERIYRDVPSCDIVEGCKHINIREMVQAQMNYTCTCIRCREVGNQFKIQNAKFKMKMQNAKLFIDKYNASGGIEYFISFESADRQILYAFTRLRFLSGDLKSQLPILRHAALIRELHTYGSPAPLNSKFQILNSKFAQHRGLGKRLLHHAEKIAKSAGYDKLTVISGVGVREYYRKLGYKLEEKWGYMIKNI